MKGLLIGAGVMAGLGLASYAAWRLLRGDVVTSATKKAPERPRPEPHQREVVSSGWLERVPSTPPTPRDAAPPPKPPAPLPVVTLAPPPKPQTAAPPPRPVTGSRVAVSKLAAIVPSLSVVRGGDVGG